MDKHSRYSLPSFSLVEAVYGYNYKSDVLHGFRTWRVMGMGIL